eukprot:gb/GECH01014434.1/.p1 GENE.gb/GECH01014434.1/~~gb/GECH01014434.1/.p1  ORF type:complete len:452 (+),score=107.65 gb/GECH01014434.1/:1-1356(+)
MAEKKTRKTVGKYELRDKIGQGQFSKVRLAVDTENPESDFYAMKIIDLHQTLKEGMVPQLKREIAVLKRLQHPHLVNLVEVLKSKSNVYIVMELITGGELFEKIVQAKKFSESVARRYFQQLIKGIEYCHANGIAHRDLKPENLMLDINDNLKIADFGLSGMFENNSDVLSTVCGTPHYIAPEVLSGKYLGTKIDIWSCGVILFVMLAGAHPFDASDTPRLFKKIKKIDFTYPSYFSNDVKSLLNGMICPQEERITIEDIKNHRWFKVGFEADRPREVIIPSSNDIENAISPTNVTKNRQQFPPDTVNIAKSLNGFELAAQLMSGVLSPLVSKPHQILKKRTRFLASGAPSDAYEGLKNFMEKKRDGAVKPKDHKMEFYSVFPYKGRFVESRIQVFGPLDFNVVLVQVTRMGGDTLGFQELFRELQAKFATEDNDELLEEHEKKGSFKGIL